jgi:uroporphyrinogen decarboxylase
MRQAGRYLPEYRQLRATVDSFLDLCYSPERATEITLQPVRRYGFDAAILFSDILVLPHALGQTVNFHDGEGPSLQPIRTASDLAALKPHAFQDHVHPVLETLAKLAALVPPNVALLGFAGAPWTLATYMVDGGGGKDFVDSKAMAYGQPMLFQRLIDMLVDAVVGFLIDQADHGAEAVQLFDSWAGALPEEEFTKWVIGPTRQIVERVKAARPRLPIIGFPRGAGLLYRPFVEQTGVDAVALDTMVPLEWAERVLQPHVALQGNLDPVLLVTGGAALDRAIDRLLAAFAGRPFIFNLGHGVLPATPLAHVTHLVERVRGWR